ncbi:hypothetical protein EIN_419270 [Entamoeba invadens IP1]|uniref:BRCT domain-containing protein n=1 Tax=Entamoeba invadens IP1 TaxID=370355 RepID=A0A0A1U1T4_ENTIV|nr:hypothetical protein EIN_419270 [Entamoeba invadens IP1]ELP87998.1 hypothetical protein EIN_419270 [Entamoeba invadens IP1]|eukprot:XP_004254769.1 hypothetical protein EIN_419270 [Entamoeba invadens IP1]
MSEWYPELQTLNLFAAPIFTIEYPIVNICAKSPNDYVAVTNDGKFVSKTPKVQHEPQGLKEPVVSSFLFKDDFYVSTNTKLFKIGKNNTTTEVLTFPENLIAVGASDEHIMVSFKDSVKIYSKEYNEEKTLKIPNVIDFACSEDTLGFLCKQGAEFVDSKTFVNRAKRYFSGGYLKVLDDYTAIAISQDSQYVALGNVKGCVTVLTKGEEQYTYYVHCDSTIKTSERVVRLGFAPNGNLISVSEKGTAVIVDPKAKELKQEFKTILKYETIDETQLEKVLCSNLTKDRNCLFAYQKDGKSFIYTVYWNFGGYCPAFSHGGTWGSGVPLKLVRASKKRARKSKKAKKEDEEVEKVPKKRVVRKRLSKKVLKRSDDEIEKEDGTESDEEKPKRKTRKREPVEIKKGSSGVYVKITGGSPSEEENLKNEIHKNGLFTVSSIGGKYDIVVTFHERRTSEVIEGIVQGKQVVGAEWVKASHKLKKVEKCAKYEIDKFSGAGHVDETLFDGKVICVFGETKVPNQIIERWITMLGGEVTLRPKNAHYVVAGETFMKCDATRRTLGFCVKEEWLYDSICKMTLVDVCEYLVDGIKKENREKIAKGEVGDKDVDMSLAKNRRKAIRSESAK